MRWFVEVSRVGDTSVDEKYCVEAKQWQAALQEARRLRGDSGPLSKFSIELLDEGYRAVDPKQKLRFVVVKAPPDAELSVEGATAPRAGQGSAPSLTPSLPSPAVVPSVFPRVGPPSVAAPLTAAPVAPALASAPVAVPVAGPVSVPAPPPSVAPPAASAAPLLAPTAAATSPSAFPPRPVTSVPRAVSAKAPDGAASHPDVIPPAPAVPQNLGPAVPPQHLTQPSPALELPPPSTVLRKRQEEPTTESPIAYREIAYVVAPGVSRGAVEALLWAAFRDLSRELAERPEQKFVQLAVFDHAFDKRPERAPLGTLAWKDWRGNPVVTFPLFDGTQPARASVPAPSIKPLPLVRISSSAPPAAPVSASSISSAASAAPSAPVVIPVAVGRTSVAPAPVVIPPVATAPASDPAAASAPAVPAALPAEPAVASAEPAVASAEPAVASAASPAPPVEPSAAIPLTREKLPSSHPSAARASRPRLPAVQRRAGEDLIGELFETMHDLHFMHGVADGAEFLLAALDSVLPCDGVLIHVFDINKQQFVVTRAKGPGAMQVLLHRTPDSEPFFASVMRCRGAVAVEDVQKSPGLLGPRWDALGVQPVRALCGPVRQGGRYLGLVEAVNPFGDAPFHQTEQNALEYICEQFAQFLVNRPIVLEADVVLRR